MSAERCPRCRTIYAGPAVAGDWLSCAQCQHRWMSAPSTHAWEATADDHEFTNDELALPPPPVPALPPAAPDALHKKPAVAAHNEKYSSDEYPPDETEHRRRTAALTNRHDGNEEPHVPVTAVPGADPFDPGMFERMAREAKSERLVRSGDGAPSKEHITSKAISRGIANARERTVTPRLINCPVCGHGFHSAKPVDVPQNCPQCQTSFNIAKGHVSSGGGRTAGGDMLLGRVLRGCLIDRKVGEGGMGAVYHARQLSLERSVAIKVLPPELARNRNFITRFEREAKSLARINHPNILHIYDFGDDPDLGIYFMIIEFVQGRDLGDMLHENYTLGQVEVLDILRQALLGLETAAAKGVIHRDIKPDNLMITEEGICKVSDFGLAKANSAERDVTSVGVRVGTPAFMSPEQCDGEDVDYRSDIYNLGCTAFLALTGQLPYDGDTPFAIMLKHKNDKVPSPKIFNPNLDARVEKLVMRMIAKLPMDRCTDIHDLIEEVERLEVKLAGTSTVLRKSRGAIKAMTELDAVESVKEHARLTSTGIRRSSAQTGVEDNELIPAAKSVQTPAPIGEGVVPEWLKPVEPTHTTRSTQRKTTSPLNPEPIPTAKQVPLTGTTAQSDMRELRNKIAEAKTRHIQGEVEQLRQDGERLAASGHVEQAASSYMRAAVLTPNAKESQELMGLATKLRRGSGIGKFIKRVALVLVLIALTGVSAFFGIPVAHNILADQQCAPLKHITIPSVRIQAYEQFLNDYGQPLRWYEQLFQQTYHIVAVDQARQEIQKLRTELVPKTIIEPPKTSKADQEIELLEQLRSDVTVPWYNVAAQARRIIEQGDAKERARPYLEQAEKNIAAMAHDVDKMNYQWMAGKQGEVIRLAEKFRLHHPRAGSAAPMVLRGNLSISDDYSQLVPMGLKITTRVVTTDKTAPAGVFVGVNVLADGEFEFCRYEKYAVEIAISAPGYRSENITVPPQADAQIPAITVSLVPSIAWQTQVQKAPRWMQVHTLPESDHLGFIRAPGRVCLINFSTGELGQALMRTHLAVPVLPASEPAMWTDAWDPEGGFHMAGTSDGIAVGVRVSPHEIAVGDVMHRGSQPVLAYRSKELTFQAGVRASYVVTAAGRGFQLIAQTREKDLWSYTQLQGFQRPQLWFQDDLVIVADDRRLLVCDESTGDVRSELPFMDARTGPIIALSPNIYAASTKHGIHLFQWREQKFSVLADKYLDQINGRLLHAAQQGLTVAVGDRTLQRFAWQNNQTQPRWALSLPDKSAAIAYMGYDNNCVVVADDAGVVTIINDQDGKIIRRVAHDAPLIDAPRIVQGRLLVADRAGKISAYFLP
jgi:serine/threonine protein kinase